LTLQDVHFEKYARIAARERSLLRRIRARLYSHSMRSWEPSYLGGFGRCITMSARDRSLLLARNPALQVSIVPNGVDTRQYQLLARSNGELGLLYVGGMSHPPSADAMLFFCQEVLPRVEQLVGPVHMWVVGADPPAELQAMAGARLHITGRVSDVAPYYERATVAVVPLRAGGGTRLKILEAMALGRPVVSTQIGCEGLDVQDGEHLLVGDDAQALAAQTARLLQDADLWGRLVEQGRRLVIERYDWDGLAAELERVYQQVVDKG
jgi:glycosyltransferase involved in cell wall biosynthesis